MTTRKVALTGIGIALFVALTLCLQVPVFENYYLCLGYLVMAVYCCCVDTVSGTLVGVLGVVLYCLLTSGLRGMPGWAAGNVVIGIMLGLAYKAAKKFNSQLIQTLILAVTIVVSVFLGILIVKSFVEYLLYSQPMLVRMGKNMYAFVADLVMLLFSIPLVRIIDARLAKSSGKLAGNS